MLIECRFLLFNPEEYFSLLIYLYLVKISIFLLPNSSEKRFLLNLRKHSKFATKNLVVLVFHYVDISYT